MEPLLALTPWKFKNIQAHLKDMGLDGINFTLHFAYPQDSMLAEPTTGKLFLLTGILEIAEQTRKFANQPIRVNSGYRTLARQARLKEQGLKAKEKSPHCCGTALDITWCSRTRLTLAGIESLAYTIEKAGVDLGLGKWLRIGWKQYVFDKKKPQMFCHLDIVPMLFDPDLVEWTSQLPDEFYPYGRKNPNPRDWKGGVRW